MKGIFGVALMSGLLASTAHPAVAVPTHGPDEDVGAAAMTGTDDVAGTAIFVMNNHLVSVRVFAEDADGRLHDLGRVARGRLGTFAVPADVASREFRVKVFPASTAWAPEGDDFGVKTNPLSVERDRQVTMWLEADLAQSIVEISRD